MNRRNRRNSNRRRRRRRSNQNMYRRNPRTNYLEYRTSFGYARVYRVEGRTLSRGFITRFNASNILLPDELRDRRYNRNRLRRNTSIGHQFTLQNNRLVSDVSDLSDLDMAVQSVIQNPNTPFEITLRSAVVDRVRKKFTFRGINHFMNWFQAVLENEEVEGSGPVDAFVQANNQQEGVFARLYNVRDNIRQIQGGCSKVEKRYKKQGLFYTFDLTSPKSKRNTCGIECLKMCKGMQQHFEGLSNYYLRRLLNLEIDTKLTLHQLKELYERYQAEGRVLVFITEDFDGQYNPKFNYIFYTKKNHYCFVNELISRDFRSSSERTQRGLLAFDFETRNLDSFDEVKSSGAKSYHMCDTIIKFVFQRYKSKKIEKMGFVTNSEKTSARQFLDWLHEQHKNGKYFTCVAHNGANFDFYLLIKELTENELTHSVLSLRGTSVIHMLFCKHVFKDPCCFMPASLDFLCKSFQIADENKKLKKFELPIIDESGNEDVAVLSNTEMCFYKPHLNFDEFLRLQHSEKDYWYLYEKYCENDCVSLFDIWVKFKKAYEEIVYELGDQSDKLLKQGYTLNSGNTIGSVSKRLLDGLTKKSKVRREYESFFTEDENIDEEGLKRFPKYLFVTKFKRGGISHCHQNGRHDYQIASVDINSQYPASLNNMFIPTGKSFWVEEYNTKWYGYYHLKNIVFNLPPGTFLPICPLPQKNSSLQWAVSKQKDGKLIINEAYVDSFMIDYLYRLYKLETFDVVKGLVSEKKRRGYEIFGKYVNVLYAAKAKQDALKEIRSEQYNPALRQCIKLFLNSLTGKLVEATERYFTMEFICKPKDLDNLKAIDNVSIKGVHYMKNREKWKPNLWVGCGVMVYSYSKRLLFEYVRHIPKDIIHVETDGIYFDARAFPRFYNAIKDYKKLPHTKSGNVRFPVSFGDDLGNIKLEHISEGNKTYDESEGIMEEKSGTMNGPWRPAYFNGKKNYFFHCSLDKIDIQKLKGFPSSTIDDSGKKIDLINRQLFVDVFNGKSVTKEYHGIRRVLHGETRMLSCRQSRTVHPKKKRKVWN